MAYVLPRLLHTLFLLLIGCFLQMALTLTLTSAWTGTMQSRSRLVPLIGHRILGTRRSFRTQRLFSSSSSDGQLPVQRIAIAGGGLAGLSTAFHLLEKTQARNSNSSRCQVTIFDTALVGTAGASSVAGGYVVLLLLSLFTILFVSDYRNICYS
jgi:hypothetical protein